MTQLISIIDKPTTTMAQGRKISHIKPFISLLKYLILFSVSAKKWIKKSSKVFKILTLLRSKLSN